MLKYNLIFVFAIVLTVNVSAAEDMRESIRLKNNIYENSLENRRNILLNQRDKVQDLRIVRNYEATKSEIKKKLIENYKKD